MIGTDTHLTDPHDLWTSRAPSAYRACVHIYNDAMAELQRVSGERIIPMALVPWWDIPASVKEIERAHAMGLRGVVTTSDPDSAGLPDIAQQDWDPFWEICGALGMPINFPIAASDMSWNTLSRTSWKTAGPEMKLALGGAPFFLEALDANTRRRVLQDNAAELDQIPVS